MADAAFHFPKEFRWGSATSAHQVEGGNTLNDWRVWEQQPGRILKGGRSGPACEWRSGRWKEDLDRAAAGGQNAHRFSLEWSRIEPEPGRWDDAELDFYREMLAGMRERGIEPLVTLHHFTNPLRLLRDRHRRLSAGKQRHPGRVPRHAPPNPGPRRRVPCHP
jgi:beta-glucosidase